MKTKISTLFTFLAMMALGVHAQQDPNYTFYRYNMNLYNPAYAGSGEGAELTFGLRSQWASVQGAPESQSAIFGMPVGKNVGLGVSILNDRTFIEQQTWLAVDFSYRVQVNGSTDLFLGIKASANSYDANTQGLITYGLGQDAGLMGLESRFTPNVGAGAYLKGLRYFVSLSVPKLLTPERMQERNGSAFFGDDRMHAYLSGGYDLVLGKTLDLKTMALVRYEQSSPVSVELTGILDFGQKFELGTSYRYDESISGLFLFNVGNGFKIGYAYETALESQIDGLDNATHELFMRIGL